MSCALTIDYSLGCADSQGGTEKVYFTTADNVTATASDSSGEITGITMSSGTQFFIYEQEMGVSVFDEAGQRSRENGTSFYQQTGTVVINKITKNVRFELNKMQKGLWKVIAKDKNGIYRMFGLNNGMIASINTSTGTAQGDRNGYVITLTGGEGDQAPIVSTSLIATITAPA